MPKIGELVNHYPPRCTRMETAIMTLKLDTAGASAPDGIEPTYEGLTITHTGGTNDIILTFGARYKPFDVQYVAAQVTNEPTLKVDFTSYVQSTGVLTLTITHQDGTTAVGPNLDNKEVRLVAYITRSDRS